MKKKVSRQRMEEYRSAYITKADAPSARLGKSLYIRKEHHDRISQIVSVIGQSKITLYGYVDNVLAEHFKRYHEEIVEAYNDKKIF